MCTTGLFTLLEDFFFVLVETYGGLQNYYHKEKCKPKQTETKQPHYW